MFFATVRNGKLIIQHKGRIIESFFPGNMSGLADLFEKYDIENCLCSSTCDFPEEEGMPDVDVKQWMNDAWKLVAMRKDKRTFLVDFGDGETIESTNEMLAGSFPELFLFSGSMKDGLLVSDQKNIERLFDHFDLDIITFKQKDGNKITIRRK